jgi:hypothetical protein
VEVQVRVAAYSEIRVMEAQVEVVAADCAADDEVRRWKCR